MAYRRRQGITKSSTFKEEIYHQKNHNEGDENQQNENVNGSLAARAIRASAAHRDSSAYGYAYATDPSSSPPHSLSHSSSTTNPSLRSISFPKGSFSSETTSIKDSNDPKYGFWGVLARKAKSILDEDEIEGSNRMKSQMNDPTSGGQFYQSHQSTEGGARLDNAKLRKRLDAITSSLNNLGGTIGNAFEEGRTIVEHKTADIIQETRNKTADILQETRKLQMRRRGGNSDDQDQATVLQNSSWQRPVAQPVQINPLAIQETQLKASRDVAMATAAKAKVLLRELKTVKADLAFAKERCAQLEEENKRLRESREKGDNPADDDLIRLQLETLLAEKARLAHENSIYARENRFLREIVEYHQLTMQDVVYLDEGAEEVTEVYPFSIGDAKVLSSTPTSPISPTFFPEVSSLGFPSEMKEHAREGPEEVSNTTSSSFQFSPPKGSPPSWQPERKASSEAFTLSQRVEDEDRQISPNTKPPHAVDEDPERPPVSSA